MIDHWSMFTFLSAFRPIFKALCHKHASHDTGTYKHYCTRNLTIVTPASQPTKLIRNVSVALPLLVTSSGTSTKQGMLNQIITMMGGI